MARSGQKKAIGSAFFIGMLSASAFGQTVMPGMDHGTMPGMQSTPSQPSPATPDTPPMPSPMPGMDHSNMPGMQRAPSQPSTARPDTPPTPSLKPEMDHGNMPGMQRTPSQPSPTSPATPPTLSPMPGMDHSNMPGMQRAVVQPKAAPIQNEANRTMPVLPYARNPDGSIPIPGKGMAMSDDAVLYMLLLDRLEYAKSRDNHGGNWDGQFWIGKDYSRFWFKTEGERTSGKTDGRLEALWSKPVAAFWDFQTGIRHDFGQGQSRQWATFGVQGISPYWFNVEAAGYLGPSGRTAARARAEYTIRLSQITLLTPELEANAYGKADRERGIGSGISDVRFSLRLRYEIRREFAPYIGINWTRKTGGTADLARQAGESPTERQIVAGVRLWF